MIGLPQEPEWVVELHSLQVLDRSVPRPVQIEQGSVHRLHPGDRGLRPVQLEVSERVSAILSLTVYVVLMVVVTVAVEQDVELRGQVNWSGAGEFIGKFRACGSLKHGFARVRCGSYRHEFLGILMQAPLFLATVDEKDLSIGIVSSIQTHGSLANWHPHLHLLVTV